MLVDNLSIKQYAHRSCMAAGQGNYKPDMPTTHISTGPARDIDICLTITSYLGNTMYLPLFLN